jgi:hypothetical protein
LAVAVVVLLRELLVLKPAKPAVLEVVELLMTVWPQVDQEHLVKVMLVVQVRVLHQIMAAVAVAVQLRLDLMDHPQLEVMVEQDHQVLLQDHL